jgi:serine/threonine-protein kinase
MEPQRIDGKYDVVRKLGEGGMGAVVEARHVVTKRRVAVKVVHVDRVTSSDFIERFEREMRATGELETQHIAQVIDSGTDDVTGHPYMVMEYLAGEDLAATLRRVGPLAPELALRIAAQACVGVQAAHDAGIVHRDIKPANLFLARRDAGEVIVKVLDFGVAKLKPNDLERTDRALTVTGTLLGSPLYMSPEQARGERQIDGRTDVWSLGVVLYEMLTGRAPHADKDTLGALLVAIASERMHPVQDLAPWIAPEIAAIVHRALRRRPDERFASPRAMLDAIHAEIVGARSIDEPMIRGLLAADRARVAARYVLGPSEMRSAALDDTLAVAAASTSRGPRRRSTVALVLAVTTLAGAGAYAVQSRTRAAPSPIAPPIAVAATPPAPDDVHEAPALSVDAGAPILHVAPPPAQGSSRGPSRAHPAKGRAAASAPVREAAPTPTSTSPAPSPTMQSAPPPPADPGVQRVFE